jgi:hypothetical protein
MGYRFPKLNRKSADHPVLPDAIETGNINQAQIAPPRETQFFKGMIEHLFLITKDR